jgi:hypothetical protein
MSKDPKKLFESKYLYTAMIALPILVAVVYTLKQTAFEKMLAEDFIKYAAFGLGII